MKVKYFIGLMVLLLPLASKSQDTLLDYYIRYGLESNLALQQKKLSYEKNLADLKEAKGMFFPNISLNARYSVANGGRTIDFPVGDLLNPVYASLNALTSDLPPGQQFPDIQLENQEEFFLRPTEQETFLSLVQPVFNPKIHHNYKMQEDFAEAGRLDVTIYKRELVAEIQKAYYNFLQAHYVLELLKQTLGTVEENVRVNKSLYDNDKVTIDVVDRSEAEYSKVLQQIAHAEKNREVAVAYFNFLLNRPMQTEVLRIAEPSVEPHYVNMDEVMANARDQREELKQLERYTDASERFIKINQANKIPTVNAAIDYGIQGLRYEIVDNSFFFLGSLVLRWDLFTGSSNNAKIQQAAIEKRILEQRKSEVQNQIDLQVIRAYYDLLAAEKSIETARNQRKSSESVFDVINKKYSQGQATLIQFLDARNSMTNSQLNLIITLADYLVKKAELERVAGLYEFD